MANKRIEHYAGSATLHRRGSCVSLSIQRNLRDVCTLCMYNITMKFEWDEKKNTENIQKHHVDFNDAPDMFKNPMFVSLDTRKDYGEDRWIGIGLLKSRCVIVVFVERDDDVIRIISARKAEKHERETYEKEITN